jgi:hypothetical protein
MSLYSTADKNARLRLILERLELSFDNKERGDLAGAQIEHVMPQTLTPEWRQEIGDEAESQWARLVHTLGNLTLTKYNAELSNNSYDQKRKAFLASHFELNRYFAHVSRWSPNAIRERGQQLAKGALKIWCDVGRISTSVEAEKLPSFVLTRIRFRDSEQLVTSWKDGFIKLLNHFDSSSPGLLLRIAADQSLNAVIAMNADRFRRSKAQIGEIFINTHASAAQLKDWCRKIANLAEISLNDFEFILPSDTAEPHDAVKSV